MTFIIIMDAGFVNNLMVKECSTMPQPNNFYLVFSNWESSDYNSV